MPPNRRRTEGTPRGSAATPLKQSCVECYRLKRKCDRRQPCSICARYAKECIYSQLPVRPTKEFVTDLQAQVDQLRRMLSVHAPGVDPDSEAERMKSVGAEGSSEPTSTSSRPEDLSFTDTSAPVDLGGDTPFPLGFIDGSVEPDASATAPPRPVAVGSSINVGAETQPSPLRNLTATSVSPHAATSRFGTRLGTARRATSSTGFSPGFSLAGSDAHPAVDSVGPYDVLERNPVSAEGYEWNERYQPSLQMDGTASLSTDPEGEGYLGFASSATLLHILRICAGGVRIPQGARGDGPIEGWTPAAPQLELFIDAYFAQYHLQYPIVHQATFRAQWSQLISQPPRAQWQLLLNVVLAHGALCASQPDAVIRYFMEHALNAVTVEQLESGSLTLVQGFCLLAALAQKLNKPNTSYAYLGLAGRMAIGLGLHRELPYWNISPFEREQRRRVWWMLWILDAGTSITYGRPIMMSVAEADVNMLNNVHDASFLPGVSGPPVPVEEPTIYTNLRLQSDFLLVGTPLYSKTIASPPPAPNEALFLDSQLDQWYDGLADWMKHSPQPHPSRFFHLARQKLFWRYCNLRIIIHRRAFLQRALTAKPLAALANNDNPAELQSAQLCLENAQATINSIHEFFSADTTSTRFENWYGLHYIFPASFLPLIALHTDTASPQADTWRAAVAKARQVLERMQATEPLAVRYLQIVDVLQPDAHVGANWADLIHLPAWSGDAEGGAGITPSMLPMADLDTLAMMWNGGGGY
ncbi:hypothetical protein Q8F55_007411 [Vanrija albida]|uniref:Zn(2)-C6 fungal-type domain-containing protein n=1 Tax=Vanrija albida TaxID=181172 RepID=A0ABR3PTH5_9TREE